jgi:hypothetical protein
MASERIHSPVRCGSHHLARFGYIHIPPLTNRCVTIRQGTHASVADERLHCTPPGPVCNAPVDRIRHLDTVIESHQVTTGRICSSSLLTGFGWRGTLRVGLRYGTELNARKRDRSGRRLGSTFDLPTRRDAERVRDGRSVAG